jgi:hypothetical protein
MNKVLASCLIILLVTNCKTSSKSSSASLQTIPQNLFGNFKDDYNISYTVTSRLWTQHPNIKYHLISYDSEGQYFIAKNDENNPSEAGLYTRIDIMQFSNMEPYLWGFCLTAYKAKTADEAKSNQSADRTNPKKGCGGYPFSRMKRTE